VEKEKEGLLDLAKTLAHAKGRNVHGEFRTH
jgi:hypothetical protein